MNIASAIKAITTILSIAQQVVLAVEQQGLPENVGSGAAKKALALATIQTIYDATNPEVSFAELKDRTGFIIDSVVAFYNTANVFVKSLKQAA